VILYQDKPAADAASFGEKLHNPNIAGVMQYVHQHAYVKEIRWKGIVTHQRAALDLTGWPGRELNPLHLYFGTRS